MNRLEAALVADDDAEDQGMHPDQRVTCHTCRTWADHGHAFVTGWRISVDEWERQTVWLRGWR